MTAASSLLASLPRPFASWVVANKSGCAVSLVGPPLVFSLIETIQSNNEGQMQKKLVELADHISEKSSSATWFDLGRVAAGLFYRHAAEEYFENSASLARAQGDYEGLSGLVLSGHPPQR